MESRILDNTQKLIDSILESEDYRAYRRAAEVLGKKDGVLKELMGLREVAINLYEEAEDDDEIMTGMDELDSRYEELQLIPEVNTFLEAEDEIIRVLRVISDRITRAVDLMTPGDE